MPCMNVEGALFSQDLPAGPLLADLAAALPDARRPVLFDSGTGPDDFAERDLLLFDPVEVVEAAWDEPGPRALERVSAALARHFPGAAQAPAGAADDAGARAPFAGCAAGWLGYDLGRQLERQTARARPDVELPDLCMGIYAFAVVEERESGRRRVVGRGDAATARACVDTVRALGREARASTAAPASVGRVTSTFDRAAYMAAVDAVREHILDGDVYQVNLAQRFEMEWSGRPVDLHRAWRAGARAPFGALIRTPHGAVISNSPELFLRRRGERLLSRPIKGTRPRGADAGEDARLQAELEASPKEQAELAMIVDLVRNDLGRSAQIGSVQVALPFATDAWPTVFHRVAAVSARVPVSLSPGAIIEAAFPPASVTGTPKIAALDIIDALEPVRRHVYTGALGWIGAGGDFDLSVAIRIATAVPGRLLVPVGGGITLASDPAAEYEETLHKARAAFEALGVALPAVDACS